MFKKIINLCFVAMLAVNGLVVDNVLAADYQSKWLGQSSYLTLSEGQVETVWVEFQNTGSANWYRDGDNALHLGTAKDLDRKSMFYKESDWLSMNRVKMKQEVVKPGETARFEWQIEAPYQSGVYHEYFRPVAENITWLNDQSVYWEWRVIGGVGFEEMCASKDSVTQTNVCTMPEPWMYESSWAGQSSYLTMNTGEVKDLWVEFENNGLASWVQSGDFAVRLGTANPIDRASKFYHSSWLSNNRVMMTQSVVKAGEKAKFSFKVQAPTVPGTYYEYFRPVVENISWLKDEGVFWKIEVLSEESNKPVDPPVINPDDNNNYDGKTGVPIASGAAKVSSEGAFEVYNAYTNKLISTVGAGTQVALKYEDGKYKIWVGNLYYESPDYVQLRAKNGAILRVDSYNDIKSWNSSLNDNLFRDTIEIRYSDMTNQTWIINELSMEDYVAGIAESGNTSPAEYLKAMAIAGRTYVTYHKNRGGRHPENFIDLYNSVNGNGDDQVYRGYGFEIRNPNVVDAAKKTVGMVVKYDGKVVVTPYFSQSDGRTRSSFEVWGSTSYPWCQSVDDPYNKGKELRGHGVGLSASGALAYASEEGKNYDWILKYYYTGIEIGTINSASERVRVGIYKL